MADWQDKVSEAASKFGDRQEGLIAGARRGLEASTAAVEKMTRFQLAVAGDLLGGTMAQARLHAQPHSPGEYFDQQLELVSAGAAHLGDRASEFNELLSDGYAGLTTIFDGESD